MTTRERTLVLLKPDAIQRSLIGEILSRIERTGLKMIAAKFIIATREECIAHYNKNDDWFLKVGNRIINERKEKGLSVDKEAIEYGKGILENIIKFITASPIFACVFEGNQSIGIVKKLVGSTEPLTSDVGTIRSDFTIDSNDLASQDFRCVRNLIHCSDEREEATREISVWFKKNELIDYTHLNEKILYDINLDGILE